MKTVSIKVFPKNTLIRYISMYEESFKLGKIKSCQINDAEVFYKVSLEDGKFKTSTYLPASSIDLFYPNRPMVNKMINVFEPGDFVFLSRGFLAFNLVSDYSIGEIISCKMRGSVPRYKILLFSGETIVSSGNSSMRLFHGQLRRAMIKDEDMNAQLRNELNYWKHNDDFIKYMSNENILDTAGLMIRR